MRKILLGLVAAAAIATRSPHRFGGGRTADVPGTPSPATRAPSTRASTATDESTYIGSSETPSSRLRHVDDTWSVDAG